MNYQITQVKDLKKAYESELDNICEQISYLEVEKKMVEDVIDNLEDILK